MKLPFFQIDAFTDRLFGGNPACVVPLEAWPSDQLLLQIARENAVAETAFFQIQGQKVHLRWFTPDIEMDLCGHATLATAHVLKAHLNFPASKIHFTTASGDLFVDCQQGFYTLDFPSRPPRPAPLPKQIANSLSIKPDVVLQSRDYVLVYPTQAAIEAIEIDRECFDQINLDPGGVVVTAPGINCDFVSRFFTPQASILEDPVTGSAHCSLIPYWSAVLNKTSLQARQLSQRGGLLQCSFLGSRVQIGGQAQTFAEGWIYIP